MARHDCNPPPVRGDRYESWRCPVCREKWNFNPHAGFLTDLWWGKRNVRDRNGRRPR